MRGAIMFAFDTQSAGRQHDIAGLARPVNFNYAGYRAVVKDPAAARRAVKAGKVKTLVRDQSAYRVRRKRFAQARLRDTAKHEYEGNAREQGQHDGLDMVHVSKVVRSLRAYSAAIL